MKSLFVLSCCLMMFACQSASTDSSTAKSGDSTTSKSRHDIIKEEKRKQSEADLPFRGLDPSAKVNVIAFGAMADQNQPQPIWGTVAKQSPDLFIFTSDPIAIQKPEQKNIGDQYRKLNRIPEYRDVREKVPFLAVWEDQSNTVVTENGTSLFDKEGSRAEFIKYWSYLKTTLPKQQKALYHAKIIGSKKRTVQVIMLDTRWDRSELKRNTENGKQNEAAVAVSAATSTDTTTVETKTMTTKENRPYLADDDKKKHFLSEEQWNWLESELKKPATLKILVSSIQVIANDHGFEKWGNFPHERDRLLNLLKSTKAKNLIILSGHRQVGAIAQTEIKGFGKVYDITAGPINFTPIEGNALKDSAYLKDGFADANFGLLKINWDARKVSVELRGLDNGVVNSADIKF